MENPIKHNISPPRTDRSPVKNKRYAYEMVPTKKIFKATTRKQIALDWIYKLIKIGILKYRVTVKKLALGRVEEMGIEVHHFPSFSRYFCTVYTVDKSDEYQRADALVLLFRRHAIYMQNMQRFLCLPIEAYTRDRYFNNTI